MYVQLILVLLLTAIAGLCTIGAAQSRTRRLARVKRARRDAAAREDWALTLGAALAR